MPEPRKIAVARIWRGRTRRDIADEYERYNYDEGIRPLIERRRPCRPSARTARTRPSS